MDLHARQSETPDERFWTRGATWRGLVLLDVERLRGQVAILCRRLEAGLLPAGADSELVVATDLIDRAAWLATRPGRPATWWRGSDSDEARRCIYLAEARTSSLLTDEERRILLTCILFDARSLLDPKDPVLALHPDVNDADRTPAKAYEIIVRIRSGWADRAKRAHSYRNRLVFVTLLATLFVAVLTACAGLGLFAFEIDAQSGAPTLDLAPGWDPSMPDLLAILAVGTFGAVGGMLVGAAPVASMGGVYNPSFLPWYALLIKIQMGALSGMLGVLILLGGFAPEITVDAWSDVVLWALVFGASQQLVTFLVDKKVKALVTSTPMEQRVLK